MIVKSYSSLTKKQVDNFYKFCHEIGTTSTEPASKNMFGTTDNTLTHILENSNRFEYPNGDFLILYDENRIVACSGVYKSSFNSNIAIAGVRTYVINEYRHMSLNRDYLLVEQKKWCLANNIKAIALTFNEYNKNLISVFKRKRLGEKQDRCHTREPKHLFYKNFIEIEFPLTIQYTKQWVVYEQLTDDFYYNWETIEYKDDN